MDLFFGDHAGCFTLPAVVGTFFFALRLAFLLIGGASDADLDLDVDVDADFDVTGDAPEGDHHADPGDAFKLLSVQSAAAFLMGFGWLGLGGLRGAGWDWPVSLAIAFAGGIGMVWLLGLLLRAVYDLQSSGNIDINDAIGAEGSVYVSIPVDGRGQVRLVINERQRIWNAVTEGEALPRRARVRVTRVNQDHTLTVAPI